MNTATVFDISAGVVLKGQKAWTQIKATAEEQRLLWLEIGNALAVGRHENPSDKLFGGWVKAYGFGDLGTATRNNALWLSANWELLNRADRVEIPKDITHPSHIRQWARDQDYEAALPADLQGIEPEAAVVLSEREGERIAKTILRSKSNGEGADIAKKQVAAFAKKHHTTPEDLDKAAKAAAPEVSFQFGPSQVKAVADLYTSQRNTVAAMEAYGFTREEIKNVFLKFASTI